MTDKRADELADIIAERRLKKAQSVYQAFRQKCLDAVNKMLGELESDTIVEMDDDEVNALEKVTEELRDLGYKFAYIEVHNSVGEITKQKLRISVRHLL
jgi:S-adenosylmethionine synthetase